MALSVVLAVLVFQGWASIESLLLIAVLTGCVNAFEAPARQAFTIDMVGRESLLNAIALNSTIFNAARTVGPAIAGVLVASFGEGWAFVLNALSFLAVIIALTAIKQPVVEPRRESHSALGFSDCLAYINSELTIKALLFIALAFSFFGYSFLPLLPVIARDVLRSGVVELGWLSAANGLGALAAALSLCFYGERFSRGKWLVCSLTLFPCALLYFGQTKTLGPALFAMTLVGYFGVTSMALVNTIIQGTVRQEYRGRVMSVYTLALMGLSPLGGLAAGTLAHWLGDVSLVISLAAIFTALASLLALRSHPAIFRL